ncbi:CpaF family protein [Roseomonas eburnea]|uniref:CpaF family protein n=1 Tax=Neoroseomonas eburnea TaxID=1346889 RepID=A0A9X9XA46_9PROT|nr:CpaF family protein [Neoroseomonas eburnea]MBR0680582.1 CpaF family protein [Neoroseomonas eburnea]
MVPLELPTPAFGRLVRTEAPAPAPATPAEAPAAGPAAAAPPAALLTPQQRQKADLRAICLARIDPASVAALPQEALFAEVERMIAEIADGQRIGLSAREQREVAAELVDDMLGLGPLAPLLEDETVTDIMVNGPFRVFIEQKGRLTLSNVRFRDGTHLAGIAQRIAAQVGRRIDESSPMVDARLPDGSRVNIIFPPLSLLGPCLSIRKFAKRKIDFQQMVQNGSVAPAMARILEVAARSRLNIIVSGGTGSGKTTMLNALSRLIDPTERIVTCEDAAELQLQQPHVIPLETRPANLEGRGEVTQRDLVKNALRMRPDRIILGECRGAEAFDMLQAMNTGHDGSMSTIHANTTRDAVTRIENMVLMGQTSLPARAIRQQIVSAVDLIVQIERMRDGVRRVTQLTEVCGLEGEVVVLNDIFQWEYEGEEPGGKLRGSYRVSRARPAFAPRLAYFGLDRAWFSALGEAGE